MLSYPIPDAKAQGVPNPCSSDCDSITFMGPTTWTIMGPGGCSFTYTAIWRFDCDGKQEFSILEVEHINGWPGCNFTDLFAAAVKAFLENRRTTTGFAPPANGTCSSNWNYAGGACWYHTVSSSNGIQFRSYKPCNNRACCIALFTVCLDASGTVTTTLNTDPRYGSAPSTVCQPSSNCSDYICETLRDAIGGGQYCCFSSIEGGSNEDKEDVVSYSENDVDRTHEVKADMKQFSSALKSSQD